MTNYDLENEIDSLINTMEYSNLNELNSIEYSQRHIQIVNAIQNIAFGNMDISNELINEIDITIKDYNKMYDTLIMDFYINHNCGLYKKESLMFVKNCIELWNKHKDLIYAYYVFNMTSILVDSNSYLDEIDYIEEVPYHNNICVEFNSILFCKKEMDQVLNETIKKVFNHYYLLINNQLNNETILNKNRLYFIKLQIEKWAKSGQMIYIYNVLNNISELLYERDSSIVFIREICLDFFIYTTD